LDSIPGLLWYAFQHFIQHLYVAGTVILQKLAQKLDASCPGLHSPIGQLAVLGGSIFKMPLKSLVYLGGPYQTPHLGWTFSILIALRGGREKRGQLADGRRF